MPEVLCAGHVNWDVTLRVDRLPMPDGEVTIEERVQKGGGSAANVACGLTGLNVDTALFGSVGDDDSGMLARRELREVGVDIDPVVVAEGRETAVKYLVVDGSGEVMVLGNAGANEAFARADLADGTLAGVDHLHLTSQDPTVAADLAAAADDAGVPLSFDPGRKVDERDYSETYPHVDVVFLNRREATALANDGTLEALPDACVTVIKRGAGGAEVRWPGGSVTHDGFDIEPLDTTGAGDAFAAGFLGSLLAAGWPDVDAAAYEQAIATANACGALGASRTGARTDLSWERLASFRAERGG